MSKPLDPTNILDSHLFFTYRDLAIAICGSRIDAEQTLKESSSFEEFLLKANAQVEIYDESLPRFWSGGKLIYWGAQFDRSATPVEYMVFEGKHVALNQTAKMFFLELNLLLMVRFKESREQHHPGNDLNISVTRL